MPSHTVATVEEYGIRYETTLISGWTRGLDHQPAPSEKGDYRQLYGDDTRLLAYLKTVAPHCHPRPTVTLADGSGSIQFIHEMQHRHELFRLQGSTSPSHGITRPLRLTFQQLRRPSSQCCSVCGEPDHTAQSCPLRTPHSAAAADDEKMDADVALLPNDGVACRLCYSPLHREDCHTPPSLQHCKICNENGHTSFRCARYKPSWVPLSVPPSSRPPNPRPLGVITQQRGIAPPSWSAVAAAGSARPSPTHSAAPLSTDLNAFPPLPGVAPGPASPTDSAPSSPHSRSTASTPTSPSTPPSTEIAQLKEMILLQQKAS